MRQPPLSRRFAAVPATLAVVVLVAGAAQAALVRPPAAGAGEDLRARRALFVSNEYGQILEYSAAMGPHPRLLRTITSGATDPQGMWIDRSGTLYVANGFSSLEAAHVAEYKRGATTPFATLSDGMNDPGSIAVDGRGTLYVNQISTVGNTQYDAVLVYPRGHTSPAQTIVIPLTGYDVEPGQLVFDRGGNLLVGFAFFGSQSVEGHVFEIAHGSTQALDTGIQGLGTGALAIDAAGNLYGVNTSSGISVYPTGSVTPSRSLVAPSFPAFLSATRAGGLYVAGNSDTGAWFAEYAPGANGPTYAITLPANLGRIFVIDALAGPA